MPELPEVETIRRNLEKDLVGKILGEVDIRVSKQFIGNKRDILGAKIISIERFGKILAFKLVSINYSLITSHYLNIHLKLTGQLVFGKNSKENIYQAIIPHSHQNKLPAKTTRIIFYFKDGSVLYFNDLRKFGWIKITNKPLKPQGTDILSKDFTLKLFSDLARLINKPIKLFLMDQDKLAGVGNIYANDALFLAKIHPMRKSKSLNPMELQKLYQMVKKVIDEGLKYNGSSDESYILPDTSIGEYQKHFKVYGQEGKKCIRCKTIIKRIKQAGRSYFFCSLCQQI